MLDPTARRIAATTASAVAEGIDLVVEAKMDRACGPYPTLWSAQKSCQFSCAKVVASPIHFRYPHRLSADAWR